jgi:hypothetical protein
MQVILFPSEFGVAIMAPSGELSVLDTAKKDVPAGVPFVIVDSTELPTASHASQETWEVDFSNPDGYGGEA